MKKIQIIAEIAGGHMGNVERCLELVNAAITSGADAIKFQFYNAEELCEKSHSDFKLFKDLEFDIKEWEIIFNQARSSNLLIYADIFGLSSFSEANKLKVDGYKIHSADLDNISLIKAVSETNKLIFLGVGGHKRIEIYQTIKRIYSIANENKIVLMPGHQLFPTPIHEHSLEEISWFLNAYKDMGIFVGCADHIDGDNPAAISFPIAAIGAGASFIEKHLTIDRSQKWEDYESAIAPHDFKKLTSMIHSLNGEFSRFPIWSEGRQIYREKSIKTYFSLKPIDKDNKLKSENLIFLRPTYFTNPVPFDFIFNNRLNNRISSKSMIKATNINQKIGILINCRTRSTRLPKKALKEICEMETIALLIERMKFCKNEAKIILCTTEKKEDDVLIDIAKREGIDFFRGPDENVALRLLLASQKFGLNHIVRVTGDDLLRDMNLIDTAIDSHIKNHADYTYMEGVVYSCDSEVISVRALETIVERAREPKNTEYLTWYLNDESAFVCNKIQVNEKYYRNYRLTLDTIEDFDLLESIYSALYTKGKPIDLLKVLEFLDENPEIALKNTKILPKLSKEDLDVSILI